MVWFIGDTTTNSTAIRQKWVSSIQIRLHTALSRRKVVYLLSCVGSPAATGTVARLNMLHGIGTGSKASFTTDGARHVTRTVNLHMHVEFILSVEDSVALVARVRNRRSIAIAAGSSSSSCSSSANAIYTPRKARPFSPLVAREFRPSQMIVAFGTASAHFSCFCSRSHTTTKYSYFNALYPSFPKERTWMAETVDKSFLERLHA